MNAPPPKTVQISPAVELGELSAQWNFLRNRTLILAQAIADLEAENAELKHQLEALQVPATPAASGQTQEGE